MENIFLAKIKNSDDRDCVYYITFNGFECNHYFGGMLLSGACFSGYEKELKDVVENDFDSLETILSKDDFKKLFELNDSIKSLGYGIEYGSDEYNKGMEIIEEYKNIIEKKLLSKENKELFKKVEEEEKKYCMEQYDLTYVEVTKIFENYLGNYHGCNYQDRAIIGDVFSDFDEMVEEEKYNYGYEKMPYFDDKAFGNDLLSDNTNYLQLESGKIIKYSY